jgi:hypothetical protein
MRQQTQRADREIVIDLCRRPGGRYQCILHPLCTAMVPEIEDTRILWCRRSVP